MIKKTLLLLIFTLTLPLHAQLIDDDPCTRADQELSFRARNILAHLPLELSRNSYILAQVNNQRILLVGQTRDAAMKNTILELLQKKLQESTPHLTNNFSIESNIELTTPIEVQRRIADNLLYLSVQRVLANAVLRNYAVNFIVVDAKLYLMGVLTPVQADQIVTALSELRGVNKIIKAFEYINS